MSFTLLYWSLTISHWLLLAAMACCLARLVYGPRAQDRVLAFDALYVATMLFMLSLGIATRSTFFFDAALVIALLGFISTAALAKFLMRGEVIE
ncbi:MAG: K+/H+ antiporter subunit F [Rhizobiaceae bacterium]|nr:K+/H+ antiporter subunit F [Rhizobiaceae bacterium]